MFFPNVALSWCKKLRWYRII